MSSNRRFEYEKGPTLEDEDPIIESDSDDDEDESPDRRDGRRLVAAPWKAGSVAGVGAFAIVFAVTYQLVGAMFAGGMFAGVEDRPSRWVVTGLVTLGSHGATIDRGGEAIGGAFGIIRGLTTHVTALVPVVVLAIAGYLLVRYVRLETRREAAVALGSLSLSYLALAVVLSVLARWTPGEGADAETIRVSTDAAMLLTTTGTVVAFVAVGAAVAALPRLLEAGPFEVIAETD